MNPFPMAARWTKYPDIIYVPEDAAFDLHQQKISWPGSRPGAPINCCRAKPASDPPATKSGWKNPARTARGSNGVLAEGELF
jgi:hypothetical protein